VNLIRAFLLGILQGATEFLPVSSSGHLVLVPWLLRWESPGLAFDAVVHWGTALAVIVYFWEDWVSLIGATLRSPRGLGASRRNPAPDPAESSRRSLAWLIVLGTVPGVLAGFFLEDFFEGMFSRPVAAAGFLLVTAALLVASERLGRRQRELQELGWVDALVVGVGQALAIFPGISRSGATIAAGLMQGVRREPAARFSFLLATPIILGAGLLKVIELARMGGLMAQTPVLIAGFAAAAVVGFGCIHFLLQYLQRRRLYPFAAYCALFGVFSLLVWMVR
jgi:undecaprenyl-diphosphatase